MKRPAAPGLFWRTFLLILLLLAATSVAWLQSFRLFEREPRAQQLAELVVSIVNITRSALLYSDPLVRLALLAELADSQGVRIVPLEQADRAEPLPDIPIARRAAERVRAALGPGTRIAAEVNGVAGIWVSFAIDADEYWLVIDRDPLARAVGTQWIGWAVIAAVAALLAAAAITRFVTRPLARLSEAARTLGAGGAPEPLPEAGPAEIATVNASFNRMVTDLARSERDRAVLLAGISHDLRTPLTRMRLEVELSELPEQARANLVGDLEQMDGIVAQFLDYARNEPVRPKTRVELAALVEQALAASRLDRDHTVRITRQLQAGIAVDALQTELARALANLLGNADRYGRDPDSGRLDLSLRLAHRDGQAVIEVADRGRGVPPERLQDLLRPFVRGEEARTGAAGAGLGLAIVDRVARMHGGRLRLAPNEPSGLRATLSLPLPG